MRFALHVIRLMTPRAHCEYVLGDTLERFAELQSASGERAAAKWLTREMWRVVLRAPYHRTAVRADARRGFALESPSEQQLRGVASAHSICGYGRYRRPHPFKRAQEGFR